MVHSAGAIALLNRICLNVQRALTSHSSIHILGLITGFLICGEERKKKKVRSRQKYKYTRVKWSVLRPIMRATDLQCTRDDRTKNTGNISIEQ